MKTGQRRPASSASLDEGLAAGILLAANVIGPPSAPKAAPTRATVVAKHAQTELVTNSRRFIAVVPLSRPPTLDEPKLTDRSREPAR
jgi:hypothetical protein